MIMARSCRDCGGKEPPFVDCSVCKEETCSECGHPEDRICGICVYPELVEAIAAEVTRLEGEG